MFLKEGKHIEFIGLNNFNILEGGQTLQYHINKY